MRHEFNQEHFEGFDLGPIGYDFCCRNDQYCFLDKYWNPQCCPQGSTCDSPCEADSIYCNTTTAQNTCCQRSCKSTEYLCSGLENTLCCDFDSRCTTNDNGAASCVPSNSTCVSGTYACSEDQGGGCCNDGTVCSLGAGGAPACLATATPSLVSPVKTGNNSLEIGLGVSLPVLAVVVGCVVFFRIRNSKKKQRKRLYPGLTGDRFEKAELPGISSVETPEIHSTALYEMPADVHPQELSQTVDGLPHELPAFSLKGQHDHKNH
ncbi:hypothetical protein F4819DRAFT_503170 [Hypoxylon fuscum]|nr:hypothetical protein F4819DRAFT_503170 [Hypoxylon fuscum]